MSVARGKPARWRDGNVWEDMSKANVLWLHKTLIGSHKTLDHAKYILSALIITAKTPMRTPQEQWRRSDWSSFSYSCCSCLFILKASFDIFAPGDRAARGVEPCPALRRHRYRLRYDRAPLAASYLAACAFSGSSSFVWCHIKKARGLNPRRLVLGYVAHRLVQAIAKNSCAIINLAITHIIDISKTNACNFLASSVPQKLNNFFAVWFASTESVSIFRDSESGFV
jgi:hypothetical protein